MTIDIVLLGTGNPLPDPQRAGAATLVRAGGQTWLVDAGRATTMRMAAAGVLPLMLDGVLITHLHSDHICDLADVITTRWVMSPVRSELVVYGPERTADVLVGLRSMFAPDVEWRRAHHQDLDWDPPTKAVELQSGIVIESAELTIRAAATEHRPVHPTLAYRFDTAGASVVVAGDTLPCKGLDELCTGADVYVQTVLRHDLVSQVPMQRFRDTIDYHSTVEQAAQTAARASVRKLVLTHQIPTPAPGSQDEWIAIATEHFDGEVIFGEDLLTVTTD